MSTVCSDRRTVTCCGCIIHSPDPGEHISHGQCMTNRSSACRVDVGSCFSAGSSSTAPRGSMPRKSDSRSSQHGEADLRPVALAQRCSRGALAITQRAPSVNRAALRDPGCTHILLDDALPQVMGGQRTRRRVLGWLCASRGQLLRDDPCTRHVRAGPRPSCGDGRSRPLSAAATCEGTWRDNDEAVRRV